MNREEIDNLLTDFDEMGFCPTTLVKNPEEYAVEWRNDMRDAIIKHEQDTLKEFVEYLKNIDEDCVYYAFVGSKYEGGMASKVVFADTFNNLLENFIKERKL